jgi:hypothetical protein
VSRVVPRTTVVPLPDRAPPSQRAPDRAPSSLRAPDRAPPSLSAVLAARARSRAALAERRPRSKRQIANMAKTPKSGGKENAAPPSATKRILKPKVVTNTPAFFAKVLVHGEELKFRVKPGETANCSSEPGRLVDDAIRHFAPPRRASHSAPRSLHTQTRRRRHARFVSTRRAGC